MRVEDYTRRGFLRDSVVAAAGASFGLSALAAAVPVTGVRAIAFDAFPIFDLRAITVTARQLFPEKGEMLASVWSTKLFESTWLETSAGRYVGFEALAARALEFAAESAQVSLSGEALAKLVAVYSQLDVWPDVKAALEQLRASEIRLAMLSDLSEPVLRANLRHAGIEKHFEFVLSTDRVRKFKPAPEAYEMAMQAFRLPKETVGFAAFGGWDATGASWFGYRTVWVNRLHLPAETLDPKPALTSAGMEGVLELAGLGPAVMGVR